MALQRDPPFPRTRHTDEHIRRDLLTALRAQFTGRWTVDLADKVTITRSRPPGPYVPPRRPLAVPEMLDKVTEVFAAEGIQCGRVLPLRSGRDTDLTISAIQALDPYLKDAQPRFHSHGVIPQPVVRFTGKRDPDGRLLPGYLTSFVNLSCVMPVPDPASHVRLIDTWTSALSHLGLHARYLRIHGRTGIWQRGPVRGITLRFGFAGRPIGDAVLLWNAADPHFMASDIGSGLERLVWLQSDQSWQEAVFGDQGREIDFELLDAVRTATLLINAGIRPGPRGAAAALRSLLRKIPQATAAVGLGRLVRTSTAYWHQVIPIQTPWSVTSQLMEDSVLASATSTDTGCVRWKATPNEYWDHPACAGSTRW